MPVGGNDRAAVELDVVGRQMSVVVEIKSKHEEFF